MLTVLAQPVLHYRGKAVVPLAEVDGLRRHHDPHPVRREDHEQARSASASSATRAAAVAASRRIVTGPMINSIDTVVAVVATAKGDATGAANSAPITSGTTSLPFQASVR